MFALQIGSWRQLPTCNVQLDDDVTDGKVLLQYTSNKVSLFVASAAITFRQACGYLPILRASPPLGWLPSYTAW